MPNDINELDVTDYGLKQIFGERYTDASAESGAEQSKKEETTYASVPQKSEQSGAHKRTKSCEDAQWEPVKEFTWLDGLRASAKSAITFGGLNLLIFYWEYIGLMDESIAIPCMWVCVALAGFGVGKNFAKR